MFLTFIPQSSITNGCSPKTFNSGNHSENEVIALRKDIDSALLKAPPQEIYGFSHYAGLVARSQQIDPTCCHSIRLPSWTAEDLVLLHCRWLRDGSLQSEVVADLADALRDRLGSIFHDKNSDVSPLWFFRLEDASPKDSPVKMPVTSLNQLLTILFTSSRARWQLDDRLRNFNEILLHFRPWDEDLSKGVEFRLFVPPSRQHGRFRISAISQYSWYKPLSIARDKVHGVLSGALSAGQDMLPDIVQAAESSGLSGDLATWGFTFDVVVRADGSVQLVEVNAFGAMSGTGSCLFHWLSDSKQLYGLEDQTEARVLLGEEHE